MLSGLGKGDFQDCMVSCRLEYWLVLQGKVDVGEGDFQDFMVLCRLEYWLVLQGKVDTAGLQLHGRDRDSGEEPAEPRSALPVLQHACLIQSPMSYIPEASQSRTITSAVHAQQSSIMSHRENLLSSSIPLSACRC